MRTVLPANWRRRALKVHSNLQEMYLAQDHFADNVPHIFYLIGRLLLAIISSHGQENYLTD
jgi:hypothetical protein